MKYSKRIRGMSTALAFAFTFMVFSFSFAPKAYAAEANVSVNIGASYWHYRISKGMNHSENIVGTHTTPVNNLTFGRNTGVDGDLQDGIDMFFATTSGVYFSDIADVYITYSISPNSSSGTWQNDPLDCSAWNATYLNDYGQTASLVGGVDKITAFSTASTALGSTGYAVEARFVGSEIHPISQLRIARPNIFNYGVKYSPSASVYVNIISCRIISSATSAEADALKNVADEIAAQSDILLAMKGDIVAILQDIYEMTGDLWIAQDLTNQYLAAMLPLLENIDQTTTNIYALLSSQLAALETAIETASTTIEAAIEAQTAAMIAYLNELFNTGNQVPDETYQQQQDAENILDQMESLEKPDVETIVPDIGDIGNDDISGALSSIFSSNLIVTMMTLSASLAFGAYVLFGKRG